MISSVRGSFLHFFFCICCTIQKMQDLRALSYHSDREGGLAFHKHISSDVPLRHCRASPEVPTGCETDVFCHQGKMMLFRRSNFKHKWLVSYSSTGTVSQLRTGLRTALSGAMAFPDLESTKELKEDASRKSWNAFLRICWTLTPSKGNSLINT